VAADVPQPDLAHRHTGARLPGVRFHHLRHFYASALIRAGESVKTVQAGLGHASAVETLQTARSA
jgi:integrase